MAHRDIDFSRGRFFPALFDQPDTTVDRLEPVVQVVVDVDNSKSVWLPDQ
jgi:hypothetical protein